MDRIAVLVPCYNESKTVEKVISDFARCLPEASVYIYDNNSSDGTARIAESALNKFAMSRGVFLWIQARQRKCHSQDVQGDRCPMLHSCRRR